jgi:hypothetical protein
MSHFINEGCILLLENDEYVVLKGIWLDKNIYKGLFDFAKKRPQDNIKWYGENIVYDWSKQNTKKFSISQY